MTLNYLHLSPGDTPPPAEIGPYRAVLIAEEDVSQDWRNEVASWLVASGCLYFVAWGAACEAWHDTVDWTVLETFDFGDIPDDRFVMTTWHEKEPLSEVLWFAGNAASHPDIDLPHTLIVHIAQTATRAAMLELFCKSQAMADEA
ncbi:hypothetical protein FHR20_000374 [Sphingomonas leidyi]|jgi:hypothetical protein|uniref:DUF7684 domain-containing protein n=1 Tax=Sphingomonas leidyi TaxID=68569 RepID=A0A7X5UWI0_9SPHN|nr:hypothetical protein [Sphingomonas leidyi]NIJ63443.1 hypothetical protein [Sphingomonas leidyi]